MKTDILLAGVGGQGTVLASKLIAQAAMDRGRHARTAETIGMAQRGGCVVSHVRIGDTLYSPLIAKGGADVVIGFEPGEAVRALPYLKKDGAMVVSSKAVPPVTASLGGMDYRGEEMISYLKSHVTSLAVIDTERICAQCGTEKVLNVALLGAACEMGVLGITTAQMQEILTQRLPERFFDMNQRALRLGAEAARSRAE